MFLYQVHDEDAMSGGSEPNSPRLKQKLSPRGSLVRRVDQAERFERHGVGNTLVIPS